MPYKIKQYDVIKGQKIEDFLVNHVGLDKKLSLYLLQKTRISDHKNRRLQKGHILKDGFIEVCIFEALSKGLKPLFETEHFAIFDKPSGVLVHPVGKSTQYTLLDEIRHYLGEEASLVHRIDSETSGLVLVSKNEYSNMVLAKMFEEKAYVKKYLALVKGKVKDEVLIDKKITTSKGLIKLKMKTCEEGKESSTLIKAIKFDENKNQTLLEAIPYTGRQHQIRVHLDSISHSIVGDPIYGVEENQADKILRKKVSEEERINISGAKRLMLQANYLEFTFLKRTYKFISKQKFMI